MNAFLYPNHSNPKRLLLLLLTISLLLQALMGCGAGRNIDRALSTSMLRWVGGMGPRLDRNCTQPMEPGACDDMNVVGFTGLLLPVPTSSTALFTQNGLLLDMKHRCWAIQLPTKPPLPTEKGGSIGSKMDTSIGLPGRVLMRFTVQFTRFG